MLALSPNPKTLAAAVDAVLVCVPNDHARDGRRRLRVGRHAARPERKR